MKVLSLALACFLGCAAAAQDDIRDLDAWKIPESKTDSVPAGKIPNVFSRPGLKMPEKPLEKAKLIGTSQYGAVYALPLDNMPCIVPNMKAMPSMPNPGKSRQQKPTDPGIYLTPPQPLIPDRKQ